MLKKNRTLFVALLLATFTLALSVVASAQTSPAPPAAQTVQPAAPLPAFLTTPAVQTPAVTPANGAGTLEWKASCTCTTDGVCLPHGEVCCWWPRQTCGICC